MSACPFCKAAIPEDIAIDGGTCPRCLLAIPGEESATDPGVVIPRPDPTRGPRLPILFGLGLVLGLLGLAAVGGLVASQALPEKGVEAPVLEAIPLSRHEDLPVAEETVAAEAPAEAPRAPSGSAPRGPAPTEEAGADTDGVAELVPAAQASQARAPVEASRPGSATRPRSLDDLRGLSGGPTTRQPEALVLEDPAEIDAMIASVLKVRDATLRQCYERRLKEREDLIGGWKVSFTVSGSGRAEGVLVRPLGMRDEEFEACLVSNIGEWRFQAINAPVEVVKTWRFGPGF